MKSLKNKFVIIGGACVASGATALWLMLPLGNDKKPHCGRSLTLGNFLNVHESSIPWLEIRGVRYLNVTGVEPCYLTFSDGDAYFFVTHDRGSNDRIAHFVFMGDGKSYDIPVSDSTFGSGVARSDDGGYCDRVVSFSWPIVVVRSEYHAMNYYSLYEFNLLKNSYVESKFKYR